MARGRSAPSRTHRTDLDIVLNGYRNAERADRREFHLCESPIAVAPGRLFLFVLLMGFRSIMIQRTSQNPSWRSEGQRRNRGLIGKTTVSVCRLCTIWTGVASKLIPKIEAYSNGVLSGVYHAYKKSGT